MHWQKIGLHTKAENKCPCRNQTNFTTGTAFQPLAQHRKFFCIKPTDILKMSPYHFNIGLDKTVCFGLHGKNVQVGWVDFS